MRQWTEEQLSAIQATNDEILVSAAAGSGKTSVMIEKALRFIEDGAAIDEMLVITFTRAAAGEMRQRLADELLRRAADNRHMARQYQRLGRAKISTIHTFCYDTIRENFVEAGIDPQSKIGSGAQLTALKERAIDEALDLLYDRQDDGSLQLIRSFEEEEITGMMNKLYFFLMAIPDPWDWLENSLDYCSDEKSLLENPLFALMLDEAMIQLEGTLQLANMCESIALEENGPERYLETAKQDIELVKYLIAEIENGIYIRDFNKIKFSRLNSKKAPPEESAEKQERFKALREELKKCVKNASEYLPNGEKELAFFTEIIAKTVPAKRALAQLTKDVHDIYTEHKRRRQLLDFNDLEHLALKALRDEYVRKNVSGKFKAIFVDEYQDISRIQEEIIKSIHIDNRLFMVGDVRQSIYRFRLADPGLFLDKYDSFDEHKNADSRLIPLQTNFRSSKNILDAVNEVFSSTMRRRVTELDYDNKARLIPPKNIEPNSADTNSIEVNLILRAKDSDEDDSNIVDTTYRKAIELEAALIAKKISDIVGKPLYGFDRNIKKRDIVILLRTASGKADYIKRALENSGIAVYNDSDSQYYESQEIMDVINILSVLDNPFQDVPLLSVLSCPCFDYSPEELADIRIRAENNSIPFYECFFSQQDNPKIKATIDKLNEWKLLSKGMSLENFLWTLLEDSNIYARCGMLPGGEQRRANLRLLCEKAREENRSFTIQSFLDDVNRARRTSKDSAVSLTEADDAVRIMTIHKSKGLEFPIVIVADLSHRFRFSDSDKLRISLEGGISIPYIDYERSTIRRTFLDKATGLKEEREVRSEEARLLYVAMTRAKNKLFLVSCVPSIKSAMQRWYYPKGDFAAVSAKSMLDWVGNSLYPALKDMSDTKYIGEEGAVWNIYWHNEADIPTYSAKTRKLRLPEIHPPSDEIINRFRRFEASTWQQKISVTSLIKREKWNIDDNEDETAKTKRIPISANIYKRMGKKSSGLSAVEKGQAVHKYLSQVDLQKINSAYELFTVQSDEKSKGLNKELSEEPISNINKENKELNNEPEHLSFIDLLQNAENIDTKEIGDFSKGKNLYLVLNEELKRLTSIGILQPIESESIDINAIKGFFTSDIGARLLKADKVYRELPFSLLLDSGALLQGVIDCCFIEGDNIILIDYKTDYDTENIYENYHRQMHWYAVALNTLTPRIVTEAYLYAIRTGEFISVDVKDIENTTV
ncbi:MAG: UvrD-helicase domain-containing protein [Christensenellales bacterium]